MKKEPLTHKKGSILVVRVRAWKKSTILPQRLDFVLPIIKSSMVLQYLDIHPIRRLGYYAGYLFSFLMAFPVILFKKYDYLLLENPYLVIFSPLARFRKKKIIAEYVDYYPANLIRLRSQKFFRYQVSKIICRIFHLFIDEIIVESETAKTTICNWGVPQNKVKIIPVGINTDKMIYNLEKRKKLRSQWEINDNIVVVGYLGKMVDYYHIDNILKTINAWKDTENSFHIVLVGDGPEKERLKALANKFNLSVRFIGSIPHSEVKNFYSSMDVFIFPLNALAIKIGEILSIGLPIIVLRGMAEDWITDMKTGIVAPNNSVLGLTRALTRYLSLSFEEKSLIKRNQREFAQHNLNIRNVSKAYLKIITS
ncbi:MAG: glycosyltransferase [Candidatus Hodarchaeales archaeon]|jgi:glycosyltransferase involved in cell wall biosynthesis